MPSLAEILAATGDQGLGSGGQYPPDHLISAPQEVRDRVKALKNLQNEIIEIETEFYARVHELECEFRSKYDAVNAKRKDFVSGKSEPSAKDKETELFYYLEAEEAKKFEETVPVAGNKVVGIPDFWLNTLKGVPQICDIITPADESILKHLTDITVENINTPPSFKIHFHFAENEFFTNSVLTKEYKLSIGPNGFEPHVMYDGPSVVATSVAKIDWKDGKDITKKIEEPCFFQFFSPSNTEILENMPEEEGELLNSDFEIGQIIRENVVDNAVLYYTGEIHDDDDFGYDGDAEDMEDLDDEDEE